MTSAEASVPSLELTPRQVQIAGLLSRYVAALPKPTTPDEESQALPRSSDTAAP
jgi:hypothetical protein